MSQEPVGAAGSSVFSLACQNVKGAAMERELSAATLCALGLSALSCLITVGGLMGSASPMILLGSLAAAGAAILAIYRLWRQTEFSAIVALALSSPGLAALLFIVSYLSSVK